MKRSHERDAVILSTVKAEEFASIEALALACETSTQTIRRDLARLSEDGKLLRYHGGARRLEADRVPSYATRSASHVREKVAAAAQILDVVPDGSSLFLAGGSTLECVAQALLRRSQLTIVTNNLHAAMTFHDKEGFRVHLVGGWLRTASGSLVGAATAESISMFSLDFSIVSTRGITADGWLLEYDQDLVQPVENMMENARTAVLVADSSKFGSTGIVRVGHLKDIDHFLTNERPDPEFAALLESNRVVLHVPNARAGHKVVDQK
ncbi:DeoR/GlpR family DNA-binding transcription regulator [Bradyrhizobium sp.]|uniref:DeoR/GlpR family DNA-binding transcription regulator n=1 Tax=Bradyrhizobium sp. TaxID=376 RepID=UPI0039E49648